MLYKWPHLKGIMKELSNYSLDIPIGLLIGANCSPPLEPFLVEMVDLMLLDLDLADVYVGQ